MSIATPNADEVFDPNESFDPSGQFNPGYALADALFIGNFHKTLPHNKYGEVDADAYRVFERACIEIEAGVPLNFERVAKGSGTAHDGGPLGAAKFTSPLAGAGTEDLGPDPKSIEMLPAPGIRSNSTAAEMVELYWMALLRDKPLAAFSAANPDPDVVAAINDVSAAFGTAIATDFSEGRLKLGLDLPQTTVGTLNIQTSTLFRCGLQDEEHGPLVSQFFLQDIPYGVQRIDQTQVPYAACCDFLTTYEDWLLAQNTGKDKYGRDYANCNFYSDDPSYYNVGNRRKIATMRDLARFVNRDALHQAYFNAALFLDAVAAPLDDGNPYKGARYSREGAFASLGGPDLLTVVSEVASRALKVVWRQKWLVHRRARPEVYGGLLEMQFNGLSVGGVKQQRMYGLPGLVTNSQAGSRILAHNARQNGTKEGTYFLPMAYSAGSPSHPAYGAGHATVAGACVTVLKAWFDETASLKAVLDKANEPKRAKEPGGGMLGILAPAPKNDATSSDCDASFGPPVPYSGPAMERITVGGELNKIASNVAMGRSMGGVHWRSDNTRSLRLGEQVAIEVLRKRSLQYAERPVSFSFRAFDRHMVRISRGQVETF